MVNKAGNTVTLSAYLVLNPTTALQATPGSGQVGLTWTAPVSAPSGSTYTVWRGGNSGGPYSSIATSLAGTSYTDTGLAAGATYSYKVSASQYGIETAASAEVAATVPLSYTHQQQWRLTNFGTIENSGDAADTADPDGDGVMNLMEYALDSLPNSSASRVVPVLATAGDRLTLSFMRARSDVTYIVEGGFDLMNWPPVATNPGSRRPERHRDRHS